ncbi:MAG: Gfo/Idh/MocA family oxidoreductase [Armatimonadetes bacterium]|nr:Gfo/Idh/MocA family oxidoreductase [Armatimonadota bacterium]MDE2206074.1 Gfo/Idh/MocA family oxidoreductase [Armatimonadota bacterium]
MNVRIAFIDHHLHNWHADTFLKQMRSGTAGSGGEVAAAWEIDSGDGDWCRDNEVPRASSIEEAVSMADAVMCLAPDNIEDHARLCRQIAPFGKPMFVDKYLAPTLAEAREIVELAQQNGAPLLCSSALRYAAELTEALELADGPPDEMFVRGMGKWQGYGIHSVSPIVRGMGGGAMRLADTGTPESRLIALDYGGRRATIEVHDCENGYELFSWQFGIRRGRQFRTGEVRKYDAFYANQLEAVVRFFQTHEPDMPVVDALAVVAILEAADQSQSKDGAWVKLATGADL